MRSGSGTEFGRRDRLLLALLLLYGAASLVHFVHNAEFLADYPGLPRTWTREGVYLAWAGVTAVGLAGWMLLTRGFKWTGLALLACYAIAGLDSLAHYVLAPVASHTAAMNGTILVEVAAAALVLAALARRLFAKA